MKNFVRLRAVFLVVMTCVFAVSCAGTLPKDKQEEMTKACLETLSVGDSVEFYKYGGTYNGNVVAIIKYDKAGTVSPAVIVEYKVDDIIICDLNDPRYKVMVYTADKEIKDLETAYNDGDITKGNLRKIKLAL